MEISAEYIRFMNFKLLTANIVLLIFISGDCMI